VSRGIGFFAALTETEDALTLSPLMKTGLSNTETASLAVSVAPEDLNCGDFVAVLNELHELPSYLWFDSAPAERSQLVRLWHIPAASGLPLKVKAICLPFVFVKSPTGQFESIDVRRVQLVRLHESYAKTVWKEVRKLQTQLNCPTNGR
jgi:hypothetical protein